MLDHKIVAAPVLSASVFRSVRVVSFRGFAGTRARRNFSFEPNGSNATRARPRAEIWIEREGIEGKRTRGK